MVLKQSNGIPMWPRCSQRFRINMIAMMRECGVDYNYLWVSVFVYVYIFIYEMHFRTQWSMFVANRCIVFMWLRSTHCNTILYLTYNYIIFRVNNEIRLCWRKTKTHSLSFSRLSLAILEQSRVCNLHAEYTIAIHRAAFGLRVWYLYDTI